MFFSICSQERVYIILGNGMLSFQSVYFSMAGYICPWPGAYTGKMSFRESMAATDILFVVCGLWHRWARDIYLHAGGLTVQPGSRLAQKSVPPFCHGTVPTSEHSLDDYSFCCFKIFYASHHPKTGGSFIVVYWDIPHGLAKGIQSHQNG